MAKCHPTLVESTYTLWCRGVEVSRTRTPVAASLNALEICTVGFSAMLNPKIHFPEPSAERLVVCLKIVLVCKSIKGET